MATIIPIKDNPNHTILIELELKIYKLAFKFNSTKLFWTMDIYAEDDTLLLSGIKIVPNYPLNFLYKNSLLPNGVFMCEISDKSARIIRDSFSSGKAKLLYLTQDELKTV